MSAPPSGPSVSPETVNTNQISGYAPPTVQIHQLTVYLMYIRLSIQPNMDRDINVPSPTKDRQGRYDCASQ